MTAYAWDVEAGAASKEILAADYNRDELVVQLHEMAVEGADPVFLGFGEDAVTQKGLCLAGIGHTVRVLGAKARLAVNALSAAVSSGGIETHTSLEYRHTLNYPLWQKLPEQGYPPTVVHYCPIDDGENIPVDFDPYIIMFDMNVYINGGGGNIYLWRNNAPAADDLVHTFLPEDLSGDGTGVISFDGVPMIAGDYYFTADATVLYGELGDFWGGIADTTTWNFTTEE